MGRLIRSILYQMKVGYLWKKIWAVLLVFLCLCMVLNVYLEEDLGTVTKALTGGDNIFVFVLFPLFFCVMATAEICGNDFGDKTINHELLSGHTRAEVYFSRAAVSMLVSTLGAVFLVFLPLLLFSALGYYGDTLEPFGLFLRLGLLCFILCRLSCEITFLTCILKNFLLAGAVGSILLVMESTIAGFLRECNGYLLCYTNANLLYDFRGDWFTYSIADLKTRMLYQSMPGLSLAVGSIAASVILGAVFLYLGYMFFKRDDLR